MLREIVKVEHESMGNNFVQAVLRIGGIGLAFHYEELAMKYDGAPLIINMVARDRAWPSCLGPFLGDSVV